MAEVPAPEQMWTCGSCGREYDQPPELAGTDAISCGCGEINTLQEWIRLPGLRCSTCHRISVDEGGGTACGGLDMSKPHPLKPTDRIWIVGRIEGAREYEQRHVGEGER
jgi:DNA-directed RNA polymerase subunit RPC12/RpoP